MFDALAAADARQDRIFLGPAVRRYQYRDRLADDFFGRIAEQPLRALVPACDDAIEVLANDGVVTRLDDGGEALRKLLVAFALGDIDEHIQRADNLAGRVAQQRGKG